MARPSDGQLHHLRLVMRREQGNYLGVYNAQDAEECLLRGWTTKDSEIGFRLTSAGREVLRRSYGSVRTAAGRRLQRQAPAAATTPRTAARL